MSATWALCLDRTDATALGTLRTLPGLRVTVQEPNVWICGDHLDEALEKRLRTLPGARRFRVLADGQLICVGTRVPRGHLPAHPWLPLGQWLSVTLDAPLTAGERPERMGLEMVRAARLTEPNVLLTTLEPWQEYIGQAALVRLQRWTFAVSGTGDVVVRGTPLPPLPGQRFVETEGVAVPAGWTWAPAVEPALVRQLLGLARHDLALLHLDGSWDRLRGEQLLPAHRSAVRLSTRGARDG